MDNQIRHLEMIQAVINRMASNSFVLKGWAVTLVAGIFALSSKNSQYIFFLVTYIPLIVFWFLDTYYLQLENKYRNLYDKVRCLGDDKIDFSMKITEDLLSQKTAYYKCFFSAIEFWFYFPTAILVAIIMLIILLK